MGKSVFSDNKIHINESLTTYRKRLFGKINTFKQQRNHKFLWTANGKILLRLRAKHIDDLIIKLKNRYQLYILGDMNIDFLKYNHHTQTEEYLDMLHSNNISPIITKPTRITNYTATLIDHIYTNNTNQMISGIATIDISDHLPTFCIVDIPVQKQKFNNNLIISSYIAH